MKLKLRKAMMFATVPGDGSVLDKFKRVRDAGFEGIEPQSHLKREDVLRAKEATGLETPSVCCATHGFKPLSHPDPSVRKAGVDGLIHALHDAQAYGAKSVLFVPGSVSREIPYDVAFERSQEELSRVVPVAAELGVKIAIENVWNNFLLSPLEAARFVDTFKSPWVGWHFDVGNVITYGWPEQWIGILGKRIVQLHIKEFSRKKRDSEGHYKGAAVDYLAGDNDWPSVLRALHATGYEGWGIAEPAYRPPNLDDAGFVRDVSEHLDRIFAIEI